MTAGNGDLARLIQEAERLHSAPGVAQSLLNLTKHPDFDVQDVVACLERDPALSARLMRVLNSSRYGLRHPVRNLRHAVLLLGTRALRLITMTFSVVEIFSRGPAQSLYTDYWRQAITMAMTALRLAGRTENVEAHDGYTAGLLAHLGTLLLAQANSETYLRLFAGAPSGCDLIEAEQGAFGFDHAELGACLLEAWGFPEELATAVREHHLPAPVDPLPKLLKAGDFLADVLWKPGTTSVPAAREWLAAEFELDVDEFIELAKQIADDVTLEAEIYGISLGSPRDPEELLEAARAQYLDVSLEAALDLDSLTTAMEGSVPFA